MSSPNPLQEFYGDNTFFEDEQYVNEDAELELLNRFLDNDL